MKDEKLLKTFEEILPKLSDTGIDRLLCFAEGLTFGLAAATPPAPEPQERVI